MQKHDYTKYIGSEYEPPFGCFQLVRRVFDECYGIRPDIPTDGVSDTPRGRLQALHAGLARYCKLVHDPCEGDVILVRSWPAHIGVVIDPPYMLHTYKDGTACVESYQDMRWRNRVLGFYRYEGPSQ